MMVRGVRSHDFPLSGHNHIELAVGKKSDFVAHTLSQGVGLGNSFIQAGSRVDVSERWSNSFSSVFSNRAFEFTFCSISLSAILLEGSALLWYYE
jgi:hypothetical protein